MKLWGRSTSFNVQKVEWLLGELEIDFEHEQLGGRHGGLDDPAFIALNPHAKVPVLEDDGVVVWESHAILRYLAAEYGGEAWWSPDAAQRSHADRWLDWHATRLQPDFMALFWGYYRQLDAQRDWPAINAARAACECDYALLNDILAARPYLAGMSLSLADIGAGATLYRYFEMGLDVPRPPHVLRWYERLRERPAYARFVMASFTELSGRPTY